MSGRFAWACAALAVAALGLCPLPAVAASDRALKNAGNTISIALPATAVGVSLLHDGDWNGLGEFAVSTGLTVGSALLVRSLVHERRPDHTDFHTLTPESVALADSSADYLWARYGWKYGLPAYLASTVVGYALTDSKRNHWYDVAASGTLAFAFNYAIVTRYHAQSRYRLSAEAAPGGAMLRFAMNF